MRRYWITILRIFRYGLHNFWRNAWLSTAATAVMTVTLLIVLTTLTAQMIFRDTLTEFRQKLNISVYLKDDAEPKEVKRFANELAGVPIVTKVEYISKEQAHKAFAEGSKDQLAQLQALGEIGTNPFPASLRINTKDPNKLEALNAVIEKAGNKALQDEKAMQEAAGSGERRAAIDTIARVSEFSGLAGMVAGGIFVVLSVMIIFNTIRMAIFNRRDEIEIMKLIGTEKRFIRGPFLVEAALYGVLAAIISLIIVYVVLLTQAQYLAQYEVKVVDTVNYFRSWPVMIIAGQLGIGILIGVFSALLAIRRYLKL